MIGIGTPIAQSRIERIVKLSEGLRGAKPPKGARVPGPVQQTTVAIARATRVDGPVNAACSVDRKLRATAKVVAELAPRVG